MTLFSLLQVWLPGTNYTLRVFGENELGGGQYSKEISVVTDGKYTCTDGKYMCTDGKYTCTTETVGKRTVLVVSVDYTRGGAVTRKTL